MQVGVMMKLFLLLFLTFNCFAESLEGIAFYDLIELRGLNSWIRKNQTVNFEDSVLKIYDSMIDQELNRGFSFVQFKDSEFGFIFYSFTENPYTLSVDRKVMLKETDFRVDVDLYDRQIVLTDLSEHSIRMILPIAHGGLSVDLSSITTPRFKKAYLDKRTIIDKRTNPSYYKGYPFIRVMTSKNISKGWTGIGLHIKQNANLKRSPDSHGCIRLRSFDLITLHRILKRGPNRHTPISIHLKYEGIAIHPFKFWDCSFKKEKNFGTLVSPIKKRGKDGLTIYKTVYESPMPFIDQII